ncbi:hypothetical protein TALK_05125 [Thalassospira alkalitolerans]|uniref:Uncharacterized protein n=1 Tax=Thalassospira alkalitolerans TaxID=1293890 RepID=A0A1Y2LDD7_9PROT|nr:hypothetical protein TALK_05125 [Thalassospira alkalitolerans]
MVDKPYSKFGKTYYPKPQASQTADSEIKGAAWRAWVENGQCYYEYDEGHFAMKLKTAIISKEDFQGRKNFGYRTKPKIWLTINKKGDCAKPLRLLRFKNKSTPFYPI